jgi:hypothetical protein
MEVAMIAPLKQGVTLAQPNGPVIETERLKLRRWCGADIAPNTAMLSDPGTARFITADGKPVTNELVGWRNAAIMAGHWALHGVGMFVVEEKASGRFAGRVGPWFPPGWPGFEVGWGMPAISAARAMLSKRRGRRSTGPSRPSSLIKSSTASTTKTPHRKPWPDGSGPKNKARPTCSAMSRMSG